MGSYFTPIFEGFYHHFRGACLEGVFCFSGGFPPPVWGGGFYSLLAVYTKKNTRLYRESYPTEAITLHPTVS